jgi:hypothetical protein
MAAVGPESSDLLVVLETVWRVLLFASDSVDTQNIASLNPLCRRIIDAAPVPFRRQTDAGAFTYGDVNK